MTMMIRPRVRWLALAVAAVTLVACSKKDDEGKLPLSAGAKMPTDSVHKGMVQPLAPPPELSKAAQSALDSGNVLQRKKMYPQALVQYREALRLAPTHPATAYGVYMAARAVNNLPLADSALAMIRQYNAVAPHGNADSSAAADAHKKAGVKLPPKT